MGILSKNIEQAILIASKGRDLEWIRSQVKQDMATGKWTEQEYIDQILIRGKIGWKHRIFKHLLKSRKEQDDYILNPFEAEEGVVQCFKCKSYKVLSVAVQTRAADEATTTLSQCTQCDNKWSHN
jgi:DNA-directed RNA polymerase subunit M/transcription elongation factor TFIIS